jgi:pilus assembly protein CpaF
MAELIITIQGRSRRKRVMLKRDSVSIGRGADCDLTIKHPKLSRQHGRLVLQGEQWWIEDLGSANGIQRNGRAVDGRQALANKDVLMFGPIVCEFRDGPAADPLIGAQQVGAAASGPAMDGLGELEAPEDDGGLPASGDIGLADDLDELDFDDLFAD